jgi:hypothetical protein
MSVKTFSVNDGFTIDDMLHFGYGHIDAARALFESDTAFFDSAGYLAHLGTEVVLKSWHLYIFGFFKDEHKLQKLYGDLKAHDNKIDLGNENDKFLKELDEFYSLRYPRKKQGPIEIGLDTLNTFDKLLDSLWKLFPDELIDICNKIDPTKKGGRVLMAKEI